MQGMPPLLTFRIDDCAGTYWWAEDAAALGFKLWLGLFLHDNDADDVSQMRSLIDGGDAMRCETVSGGGFAATDAASEADEIWTHRFVLCVMAEKRPAHYHEKSV